MKPIPNIIIGKSCYHAAFTKIPRTPDLQSSFKQNCFMFSKPSKDEGLPSSIIFEIRWSHHMRQDAIRCILEINSTVLNSLPPSMKIKYNINIYTRLDWRHSSSYLHLLIARLFAFLGEISILCIIRYQAWKLRIP